MSVSFPAKIADLARACAGINVTRQQVEYEWDGTYHPTLPVRILGPFRRVAMAVGNNDRGVRNVILGAGNESEGKIAAPIICIRECWLSIST